MPLKKKHQFTLIHVGKELRNGSKFEPVGVFYTHYRARKFLLEQFPNNRSRRISAGSSGRSNPIIDLCKI
jgi:hypothetical protein